MRRQRNMAQMKEHNRTKKELNKMQISNLSEAEFKTQVLRMLKEFTDINIKKDPGRNECYTK